MKIVDPDAPDLGCCDWCSSPHGKRTRLTVRGLFNDGPALYRLWLCKSCAAERRKERSSAA